ncbi:hypothetical protein QBC38DRAFT_103057 [Podospora fimiseda]|uniref:Uncharacterized protein n=1 Tax=Podospora fimiseda TaxID=252190 RepID=A0AAN7BFC7_9PEZI|nr:hypothetical protein QBC38DRAFT_103057 [Podospora fimiseda]
MGPSSKFPFSLSGRKTKPQHSTSPTPPQISEPLTKAQRILGTTAISIDLAGTSGESPQWESRSGSAHRHEPGRWEEESDIIPRRLGERTDASSLGRRRSTSTITSYYEKDKLPLSISQQTSNSAMAKGLPSKAQALLDIDGNFNTEPRGLKKKKPSRLDLSSLLPRHRSKQNLRPESEKSTDMLRKSPSVMSLSPAPTPPPIQQRIDKSIRKKMTKESLREMVGRKQEPPRTNSAGRAEGVKHLPVKASLELHNLYDHYEQRTFDEAMDHELRGSLDSLDPSHINNAAAAAYPTPPGSNTGHAYLSPFPQTGQRAPVQITKKPKPPLTLTPVQVQLTSAQSPVSADCASVSSRHTRTSKASKRTDHSLNDLDLFQNSVLALSSDSEEDEYDPSTDQLSVPPMSDGPASPVSPRSAMSQPKSDIADGRNKQPKQTTFAINPQYIPPPGPPPTKALPKISIRTTSLSPNSISIPKASPALSQTSRAGSAASRTPTSDTMIINMIPKKASKEQFRKRTPVQQETQFEDFPAPPGHSSQRPPSAAHSRSDPEISPTSVDFYLESEQTGGDNGSTRSNNSRRSSQRSGRRGSITNSIHENDSASGRFMAVTRQEEMLLAALRQKRARMREDILAEFEDETDRDDHVQLKRTPTNDSCGTSLMSRQSTVSSLRPEMGTLSARPRHQASLRAPTPTRAPTPSQKMSEIKPLPIKTDDGLFITLDDFPSPMNTDFIERRASKASRNSSLKGRSSSVSATPRRPSRSGSIPRRGSEQVSPKTVPGNGNNLPNKIVEEPAEEEDDDDDDEGVPRPDSPISPSDFPIPAAPLSSKIVNKKQVRLSAVGYYKPNVESEWWDDAG